MTPHWKTIALLVVVAPVLQVRAGGGSEECADAEVLWQRTADESFCVPTCRSDEDCPGEPSGDERCRLLAPWLGPVDVFVDEEMAAELDLTDVAATEGVDALLGAAVSDMAASVDGNEAYEATHAIGVEDGYMVVDPECEGECAPMTVALPQPATSVRVCDPLWDVDLADWSQSASD